MTKRESGKLFLKGPVVNISDLEDPTVFVTIIQPSLIVQKQPQMIPKGQGCVPVKLLPLLTVTPFTPTPALVSEAFTFYLSRFAQTGIWEGYLEFVLVILRT